MVIAGMESLVNCPKCGELSLVVLKPYQEEMSELMKEIEGSMGVGKTNHFEGFGKCKCGVMLSASLHVTAIDGK